MKSYWNENSKTLYPKITQNLKTNIFIIGGGLSGLSLGYYLSPKYNVIIAEKDLICSSTSGKNTGKVTSQHGLFYEYLIKSNGEKFAEKYLKANEKAISNIEEIIEKEHIDCDFKKVSAYVFTQDDNYIEKIKNEEKAVNKISKNLASLTTNIDIKIKPSLAIKFKNQAKLHPVKYGIGLSKAITKNGGKIYENSIVTDIKKQGEHFLISVNNSSVIADIVIIASRYPSINFPGYYFLKMYQSSSYAIVADTKEKLFEDIYISAESPTVSFRTIEEDGKTLLLTVGYDYKTGSPQTTNGYLELEKKVKKMYPNSEILYRWCAEDAITLDKIPYIGEYSNIIKNMYIVTGFNKWGLTTSNISANIVKDLIDGKENPYSQLFKSTRLEPIKNKDEMKNMLTEVKDSLILSKFELPKESLDKLKNGEGKIININDEKVGVYKSETGEIFKVKPICTHLGCELYFNNFDKTWECPCHGSKFTYKGEAIEVPGLKNI